MSIIIFSVSIGNGHDQVANTIKDELLNRDPSINVMVVNMLKFINPLLDKMILASYMNMLNFSPKAWGKLYNKTDSSSNKLLDISDITNIFVTSKILSLVEDNDASLIICTNTLASMIVGNVKEKTGAICPLMTVITDYTVHYSCINDYTDYFILPHENLSYITTQYGIDASKILTTGIPIRSSFSEKYDKQAIYNNFLLKDKNTILVMGGGLGLGSINDIITTIDEAMDDVQILAVTGRNIKLETSLRHLKTKNRLIVFGFTTLIPQLMEVSDIIITKPGGVTTAEILAKNKPMLIFDPLPGQEMENTEFLLNAGIAVTTPHIHKVPYIIDQTINSVERLSSIQYLCKIFAKPDATIDLVNKILEINECNN